MRRAGICVMALPLAACGERASAPAAIEQDSAGIAIVEQVEPAAEPIVFTLADAPDWVLQSDEANPDRVLHEVRGVVSMRDAIAVANTGASQVWIYDAERDVLAVSGGPGDGPGEFSGMSYVHGLPGDSLLVTAGGRYDVLGPDGAYARSFRLDDDDRSSTTVGVVGSALVIQRIRPGEPEQLREDVTRGTVDVLRFDLAGRFLDSLTTVPGWEAFNGLASGFMIGNMPIPFGRGVQIEASPRGVLTASSYDNEVRVYDASSELERIIRNVAPPGPPVMAEEVAALEERMLEGWSGPMREAGERAYEAMPAASTHPPFRAAYFGTDGSVWLGLRSALTDDEDIPAIVYGPDGMRLGGALLPSALRVTEISLDHVLGVWTDSLGVESVRSYTIERGGP